MYNLQFKVELLSDTIPASGVGSVAIIDQDIVTDNYGFPLIPGRRLKGLLRESAIEFHEALEQSGQAPIASLDKLFGKVGDAESNSLIVSDARLDGWQSLRDWVVWGRYRGKETVEWEAFFHPENVLRCYTYVRKQTALQDGVAKSHALRTLRVLKKGLQFVGTVSQLRRSSAKEELHLLALAFGNVRHLGAGRNRGYGRVKMTLLDEGGEQISLVEAYQYYVKGGAQS